MAELENKKHELFCQEYSKTGKGCDSYYKVYGIKDRNSADAAASRLLRNSKIITRLKELGDATISDSIATMTEIKEFWTNIIRNKEEASKNRLKASELMAKSYGAFLEKLEITAPKVIFTNDDNIED